MTASRSRNRLLGERVVTTSRSRNRLLEVASDVRAMLAEGHSIRSVRLRHRIDHQTVMRMAREDYDAVSGRYATEFPVHPQIAEWRDALVAAFLRGDLDEHGRLALLIESLLPTAHPIRERHPAQLKDSTVRRLAGRQQEAAE